MDEKHEWRRGFRILMGFSFGAALWQTTLFLLSGALMSLVPPAAAVGAKLLVDAALGGNLTRGLIAAVLLAVTGGVGLVNTLYYIDLLFTVAEKAGAAVDKRLIGLMAEVPGLEHHERPEYLDQLDLLREERSRLAWMTNATAGIMRVAVQLVASAILLGRVHPLLLLLPLAGVVSFLTGRRAQDLELAAIEHSAEDERLRQHLFETATSAVAAKEMRVFGLVDEIAGRHSVAAAGIMRRRDRADWQGAALEAVGGLVSGTSYIGAIGLVLVLAVHHTATPGDVVLAVGLAAGMNALITTAVLYGTSFLRVLRLARRFLWLVDYAGQIPHAPARPTLVPERLSHGIELRGVSFRYPGTEKLVLDDVSLLLPAGSVVALVGDNGAGKSTIVKLLSRFYEASAGSITVDGADLGGIDVKEWRSQVSAAFQDFTRFELLTRETVGLGELSQIEDAALVGTALKRAGAQDVPARLPQGLETQLGKDWQGGVELSGGQWQKLALGRAMMRHEPLLLVLDEPTASLDVQTEFELFERYAAAAREAGVRTGTITLLVTHRFSTVRMADTIVVRKVPARAMLNRMDGLRLPALCSEVGTIQEGAMQLEGKIALVTGAASGIGLAVARELTAHGATLTIADLPGDHLTAAADEIGATALAADLSNRAETVRLACQAGPIDILVNNAGLQHVSPVEAFEDERWDRLLAVMLTAPFVLIRELIPGMYERGWGRIINLASVHGLVASPYKAAYISAKHGVIGLTKTVALEAAQRAPGVSVHAVAPSYVRTPLVERQIADQARMHGISEEEVIERILLVQNAVKRLIEPEEVARAVAFLCGDGGPIMTGSVLTLDAGRLAQ